MRELNRRTALGAVVAGAASVACSTKQVEEQTLTQQVRGKESVADQQANQLSKSNPPAKEGEVQNIFSLTKGRPWKTQDPFLFCVHHNDRFPRGNANLGPAVSLAGRKLGQDFDWKDGWNMYHGQTVPGFPEHPHRGFETVTVVRKGRLDHSDSLGAMARYGDGDVQWLTAGAGIKHAEMFPLLETEKNNPLDLFQIWLNLPAQNKLVDPYFRMLWADSIPQKSLKDTKGRVTDVSIRAGSFGGISAPAPPPHSWASDGNNAVGIWTAQMAPHAQFRLPLALSGVRRSIYFFEGHSLEVAGQKLSKMQGAELSVDTEVLIKNGAGRGELLILQGRPIGQPVARRGPFVMNTQAELREAYSDFRRTGFGGWPWQDIAPVHGRNPARFARRVDGKVERPG